MLKSDSQSDLIPSMFVSTAVAMIFTQLAGYVAVLIDGIITSRALGYLAYSAISLLVPFNGVILLVSMGISAGVNVVCSQAVGRGEKDKAHSAFTVGVIAVIVSALLLVIACVLWPSELFRICGITETSHPEIYSHMAGYLKGYMPGILFHMMIQILGPVIVIDSGKALFTSSSFFFAGADIAGDLLNAYVFHGGTFGMGLATSASYFLQFLMLMTHFMKNTSYFRISLKGFESSQLTEMMKAASPMLVLKLATALRDLAVNRINLSVALSAAAIAARGIQNDLNTVLFCIGIGIGNAVIIMAGMFFGANDRRGMNRLFSCTVKMSVIIAGTAGVISYFFAEWIAECFTSDPEVINFAAFSIKCMALGLVPDTLSVVYQRYLQGINERGLVNFLSFADRFFIPVAAAYVMGIYFGSKGIMASIAAGKIILIIFIAVTILVRTGSLRNFMFLPKNFGGTNADNIYSSITSQCDVMRECKRAEIFCQAHGVSAKDAKLMALFVEETAGNIIAHGKPKRFHRLRADYRLSYSDGKICMTLRDCCRHFDPSAFYEAHKDESAGKISGIKIVMGLADDVRYFNAFSSNNIMIYIDTSKGGFNCENLH
ncbi:MAG: ATP-binding protein [Synergistaceae bacterium]|nr:ATP-binding protein [Synergistaceae bacterium]